MHPIHYSLIINLATLAVCGFLSLAFAQPLLIVFAVVMATHALDRFKETEEEEEFPEQPMGFTADVK